MKNRVIMFFLTLVGFYLLGSFIQWDFNAGNWSVEGRALGGAFGALFAVMAATFPYDLL